MAPYSSLSLVRLNAPHSQDIWVGGDRASAARPRSDRSTSRVRARAAIRSPNARLPKRSGGAATTGQGPGPAAWDQPGGYVAAERARATTREQVYYLSGDMAAPALPGDMLVTVVHNGGGAPALVKMLCTCHIWRAVLLAEGGDQLWRTLAMKRFPRLRLLLEHTPTTHAFRIIYRQQLAAEHIRAPVPLPPPPPLSAYIFAMEWRAEGGITGSWSGEVTSLNAWLPVLWSGPVAALEQMRKDMRAYYAAGEGVAGESEDAFEPRYEAWCDTSSWAFVRTFTVSLSVMRRSDLATLLLSPPEEEQEVRDSLEEDPLKAQAIRIATERCSSDSLPGGSKAYGLIDHRHIASAERCAEEREIPHFSLHVDPVVRIGSSNFAESGITADAMGLGFWRLHYPADNHAPGGDFERTVPATHSEVLRYLAYDAPWPAPVGV